MNSADPDQTEKEHFILRTEREVFKILEHLNTYRRTKITAKIHFKQQIAFYPYPASIYCHENVVCLLHLLPIYTDLLHYVFFLFWKETL